ncbi:hypothetical protein QYM36_004944 [Artemia franciscana]|uniref:PiggyBac transposable element-derived protein domain-containing protein n=1 Tax=Artemia franciscana TaxID=6661 RepID=A0AA88IE83_ARTSF|nr:hypothetical protein QYM36_004944 [Artemia franciscana]
MTKDNKFIDATKQEIYSYLSITLYMGIIGLPSYKLYWEKELNYTLVSGKMSQDCFTLIRRYSDFNDNSKCKPKTDPGHNRLFKVRPSLVRLVWEILPHNRSSLEWDNLFIHTVSIFRLSSHQILSQQINYGFKVFTRDGSSGIMYDINQGRGTVEVGPFGLGGDRKELKRFGRGHVDWRVEKSTNVCLVFWYDNKAVTIVSNYVVVEPKDTCRRVDFSKKIYMEIERPAMIKEYNKYIGGVDLAYMLIELYRSNLKTRKWCMRIFYYALDSAAVNAWLIYRRNCWQSNDKPMALLKFKTSIAYSLGYSETSRRSPGRPLSLEGEGTPPRKIPTEPTPPPLHTCDMTGTTLFLNLEKSKNAAKFVRGRQKSCAASAFELHCALFPRVHLYHRK